MAKQPVRESKPSTQNRRQTGEANLARGEAHRWKPGQSGNPGGRPRTAKLSEACRAKLASIIPGDARGRTHAEAIADELARRALKGDIRAAQELADRAEGRPGQDKSGAPSVVVAQRLSKPRFGCRLRHSARHSSTSI